MRKAIISLILLMTPVFPAFAADASAVKDDAPDRHVVVPGDTLWSIAEAHTPAGGDVRRTVADIRDLSGIDGSTIRAGQTLRLPTS